MRGQGLTRHQLIQWSEDGLTILLQYEVFIPIMINGIAKGIQQGGPPISNRATTGLSILRISNVASRKFQPPGTPTHNDVRPLNAIRMVFICGIAEVDDHRIVQHVPITFWNFTQLSSQVGNQLGMMEANDISAFFLSSLTFIMSDRVIRFGQSQARIEGRQTVQS